MDEHEIAERRLTLEERKSELDAALARERLLLDQKQAGRFSGGAVTLIGSAIAVISAVATTTIGGFFQLESEGQNNAAQLALTQQEVLGQLELKRAEVEGNIRVQALVAEAERDRLEIEQKFEIIVQATKGLPPDIASENLRFFVEAGILDDPDGSIRRLADEGRAPDLPAPVARERPANPLLERLAAVEPEPRASRGDEDGPRFVVEEGVVLARGSVPVTHRETAAHGAEIRPRYAILHFTASVGPGAVSYLTGDQARASTHLVVQRDGAVVQMLPLDHRAWHAGASEWGGLRSLNNHSIGISFENWGKLERSDEAWQSWSGRTIPEAEVFVDEAGGGWHAYTRVQIEVAIALMKAVTAANPEIVDIIGHSDVATRPKLDPGPALPIGDIREAVFARPDALPPPE